MTEEITFTVILKIIGRHLKLILILALLGLVLSFSYAYFLETPVYSSSGIVLVQNTSANYIVNDDGTTQPQKILGSDFASSAVLAKNCSILFQNDPNMKSLIKDTKLSIESIEDTNFLKIKITSDSRSKSEKTLNDALDEAIVLFNETFSAGEIKIIDYASPATYASASSVRNKTILGGLIGLFLGIGIAMIYEISDSTIKPYDDLYDKYGLPVFAEILDLDNVK